LTNGKLSNTDFITVFKTLFLADKHHLATYGTPILGDWYAKLPWGPVPSLTYDVLEAIKTGENKDQFYCTPIFEEHLRIDGEYHIKPKLKANLSALSGSELECLDLAIEENKDKAPFELSKQSHGKAWEGADKTGRISYLDMASEAGADPEMLKYIELNSENLYVNLA